MLGRMRRLISMDDLHLLERAVSGAVVTVPILVTVLLVLWRRHTALADTVYKMQERMLDAINRHTEAEQRMASVVERLAQAMERRELEVRSNAKGVDR